MYKLSYEHPPHLHKIVPVKSAFLHLHWLLHPLVHPQLMSARHAAPAGGNVIHFIFHCALATSQVHPKSAGLGNCGVLIVAWPHTWPASYPTLNTCCSAGASCVGGRFSISLPFLVNSTILSPLMLLSELPPSYIMTINLSVMGRTFMTLSVVDILDSVHIVDVASSCCPGGTFSFPGEWRRYLTSSQGMEWRKATAFSVAKCLSCCVNIPECSASTKCEPETVTTNILRHTNAYDYDIYVSTVLRRILFIPCSAPSEACTNILVSASSCVQLISPAISHGADDNTSSSRVTITRPANFSFTIPSLMRWKSSDLLLSTRRNSCQLLGTCLFPSTCLMIHLPLFLRVAAFRLSFPYASNTISTRCTSSRSCLRTYSMTRLMYPSNETGVRGFVMLTMTAPSRITMWATCGLTVSWCGTSSESHSKRSAFVLDLKAP